MNEEGRRVWEAGGRGGRKEGEEGAGLPGAVVVHSVDTVLTCAAVVGAVWLDATATLAVADVLSLLPPL